jgi:hypothetical protein
MDRRERERIMRQGVVLPETPRQRRELAGLEEDLRETPLRGRPLRERLRNFRPDPGAYFRSLGGPLPYMTRLREIERLTGEHEQQLAEAYAGLRDDPDRWRELAAAWNFYELNELIESHNRWYPAESRLPMDPRRGDFALVNGEHYAKRPLDAAWVLERYPAQGPV